MSPDITNGHRRRQLRARVLAEETHCALCGGWVDQRLKHTPGGHGKRCPGGACPGCSPHPMGPVVDEDVPRARGGSPYDRDNCHLMHRACNGAKGVRTIAEYHAKTRGPSEQQVITNLIAW